MSRHDQIRDVSHWFIGHDSLFYAAHSPLLHHSPNLRLTNMCRHDNFCDVTHLSITSLSPIYDSLICVDITIFVIWLICRLDTTLFYTWLVFLHYITVRRVYHSLICMTWSYFSHMCDVAQLSVGYGSKNKKLPARGKFVSQPPVLQQ